MKIAVAFQCISSIEHGDVIHIYIVSECRCDMMYVTHRKIGVHFVPKGGWNWQPLVRYRNWRTISEFQFEGSTRKASTKNPKGFPWFHLFHILYKDTIIKIPLLVGGIPTPLKNVKVKWDYCSQYMESHKSHVPNPQPDYISSHNLHDLHGHFLPAGQLVKFMPQKFLILQGESWLILTLPTVDATTGSPSYDLGVRSAQAWRNESPLAFPLLTSL